MTTIITTQAELDAPLAANVDRIEIRSPRASSFVSKALAIEVAP